MHVVGGLYKELCTIPQWSATFGSGGRAAAVISGFSEKVILHTYAEDISNEGISSLKQLGVEVITNLRSSNIVFAYFHPLSRPYIQPNPNEIEQIKPISVSGDAVLRFGFIEGDTIVTADRAVYDPQTWRNVESFSANGSVAQELAIVLNELELKSATQLEDLGAAAAHLLQHQGASVVIAKRGIRGATIFEHNGRSTDIPCYRSSYVFKIGTGDVFSAIFSYYWAEKRLPVLQAADFASRLVAAYCNNRGRIPLEKNAHLNQVAWKFRITGTVKIEGIVNTIGQRYTIEEARFALRELGVEAYCPALGDRFSSAVTAILILTDGLGTMLTKYIEDALSMELPIVILCEDANVISSVKNNNNITVVNDFSSSLYFAAWIASE